ncbi:cystatin-A [Acrasis kona]|uniref:Cystatin-A n=1 Tax=Acrasis kona TaxID=1008807 RepID=A0AAW2Z3U4_9EUKA
MKLILLVALIAILCLTAGSPILVGGTTEAKPANKKVQVIADSVKGEVEALTNDVYDVYEAVSYATQVVAGVNYFIKVKVGKDEAVHLKVYQGFTGGNTLSSVEVDKSLDDDITYF